MIGAFHVFCYYIFSRKRCQTEVNKSDTQIEEVYVACINSVLNETGQCVRGVEELQRGVALVTLVDTLWPGALCQQKVKESGDESAEGHVTVVLDYLTSVKVKHSVTSQQIIEGDLKATLELLWLIFLHLCVHTPRVPPFQRNVNVARRQVLNWCRERLPSLTTNHLQSLVHNITTDGAIIDLLSRLCSVKHGSDSVTHLRDCLTAVQKEFGVLGSVLDVERVLSGAIEEEILLIYLTLLRRKVKAKEAKALANSTTQVAKPTLVVLRPEPPTRLAWTM